MKDIEDEITASPSDGAPGLTAKMFFWIKPDFDNWAPGAYIRLDSDTPSDQRGRTAILLRDMAKHVPEIEELAAAIIHEDAELIDADMDILWVHRVLADMHRSHHRRDTAYEAKWRRDVDEKLATALGRIASTQAKTPRGEAIKAKHAKSEHCSLVELSAEHKRLGSRVNEHEGSDDPTDDWMARRDLIEVEMSARVGNDLPGIIAQVKLLRGFVDEGSQTDDRDLRLADNIIAGLRAFAEKGGGA